MTIERKTLASIAEPLTPAVDDPRAPYGYVLFLNSKGDIICMCKDEDLFDADGMRFAEAA